MLKKALSYLKFVAIAYFAIALQVSMFSDLKLFAFLSDFNLPITLIIISASLFNIKETMVLSCALAFFSSMLVYDASNYWIYPVLGIAAAWFNPESIPDKFLIALIYTVLLSPLFELFNPLQLNFTDKFLLPILLNFFTVIPLFFVMRFFYNEADLKLKI